MGRQPKMTEDDYDDDDSGGSSGGDYGGGGVLCLRMAVALVASVLIIALIVLLILLGIIISNSAGKVAEFVGHENNSITEQQDPSFKFTWLSYVLIFVAVLVSIALLAQCTAFVAVVCMNRCLASVYAAIQIFFLVIFIVLLILGGVAVYYTMESQAEQVTGDGEVVKVNLVLMLLTKLARGTMNEQYNTGLGGIKGREFEQEYECCGLVSPDEYWNTQKRMHDPLLELAGKDEDERKEAMKIDPRANTGGSWWHIKCLQDNVGTKDDWQRLLGAPLCYAPKSCCKENNDGCNDASITLKDLNVTEAQLIAVSEHKITETRALWKLLLAKQTADKEDLVTPVNKAQMFDESCMKEFRKDMHHYAIWITGFSGCVLLLCIVAITIMCILQSKM